MDPVGCENRRDGKWIYCASNRTGRLEVYRLPAGGGPLTGLTHNGGVHAEESTDRKWLYYAKDTNFPALRPYRELVVWC